MSRTLEQLRKMSTQELVTEHDRIAKSTQVGISYYLEELSRRERDKQTETMLSYTKAILLLTVVVTIATILNVVVAFYS